MGLKTTNYQVEELGVNLPEAYAVVKKITAERGNGTAIIAISTSRDNAINKKPLEEKRINFAYNIDVDNLVSKAYEAAKAQRLEKGYNEETGQIEDVLVNMPFYGWQDDII